MLFLGNQHEFYKIGDLYENIPNSFTPMTIIKVILAASPPPPTLLTVVALKSLFYEQSILCVVLMSLGLVWWARCVMRGGESQESRLL